MTPVVDVKVQSAIEAEARAWIIQLDGHKPSREDLAALREWAGRSPRHYATLREMAELWGDLDDLSVLQPAYADTLRAAAPRGRIGGPLRWGLGLAAALALVCALAVFLVLRPAGDGEPQIYATAVGEQRLVHLADGSEIQLNTGTVVEVDYRRDARRIRLVEGEAMFTVAHDAARPFVVAAARAAVRAVGTAFSVRMRPADIVVIVAEGTVGVINDGDRRKQISGAPAALITAGQMAEIAGAELRTETVDPGDLERLLSWSRGVLTFEGEPLQQVLDEMGRYASLRFDIEDPELARLPIGGRFPIGDTEGWIDALSAYGIQISRDGDVVRLSRETDG